MSVVGIATHLLAIFTVCKSAFLIYSNVFLVNLMFFYHEIWYFSACWCVERIYLGR